MRRADRISARLVVVATEFAHCTGGAWRVYLTVAVLSRRGQADGDERDRARIGDGGT
jgi:hypothetical protein